MFCKNCGAELGDQQKFCANCGTQQGELGDNTPKTPQLSGPANPSGEKSILAFVLGLIGSIFGLFGGMCVTACYTFSVFDESTPMFFMIGGSIVGLIGSVMCYTSKAKLGSVLEIVAALMIAICAFGITGADMMSLVAIALLGLGGVLGALQTFSKKN